MATADEVPSSSSTTRSRPSSPRISSPPSSPFDQQRPLWPRRKRGGGGGGRRRRSRSFAVWIAMVGFFVLMNWWMFSRLQNYRVHSKSEEISTAIAAADATSSDILQLAALDFIVCSAADVFSMTDDGSQFSSLVQGYRMYYGEGKHSTIRPNKRRLASIFARNATIEWKYFQQSIRKATRQNKKVEKRPVARSIYRHPRCVECMCRVK